MNSISVSTVATLLIVVLGGTISPVQATEQQSQEQTSDSPSKLTTPSFSEVDKDNSGFISIDEAAAAPGLTEQITEVDENADGKISREEYEGMRLRMPPAFSDVDKNKDGFIATSEAGAVPGLSERMMVLDRNLDGKVSPGEYRSLTTLPAVERGAEPMTRAK